MKVHWTAIQKWLAESRLARQVTESLFRAGNRRHLTWLDQLPAGRCQLRTLLGLVHQARATRFGLDHDFGRIRSAQDFRRLVPLSTPAELWRQYWQPPSPPGSQQHGEVPPPPRCAGAHPQVAGATWPGPLPAPILSPVGRGERPWVVAVSAALQAAHRVALRTALALAAQHQPRARLLSGTFLFLNETSLPVQGVPGPAPAAEEFALGRVPLLLRPYTLLSSGGPPSGELPQVGNGVHRRPEQRTSARGGGPGSAFAERAARTAVTCLAGPGERLVSLLQRVKQVRETDRLAEIWPGLRTVLYTRLPTIFGVFDENAEDAEDVRSRLRALVGDSVLLLETAWRPEGPIAVEDPRHGVLRLLPDHGVYFEFVPVAEADQPRPTRHTLDEVELGVPYELALTSPAGLWACRLGLIVRFEKRNPPLLSLDGAVVGQTRAARVDAPAPLFPAQALHRQSGDSPAGLPESFVHSPWSTPWGRE